jgi:hypothetical protein
MPGLSAIAPNTRHPSPPAGRFHYIARPAASEYDYVLLLMTNVGLALTLRGPRSVSYHFQAQITR